MAAEGCEPQRRVGAGGLVAAASFGAAGQTWIPECTIQGVSRSLQADERLAVLLPACCPTLNPKP